MKRFFSWIIIVALVFSYLPAMPVTVQAAEETPAAFEGYTAVSTKEELDAVRNNLSGKYYLTADIVFTDADFAEGGAFYNDGAKWIPIGTSSAPFCGVFDGNGHAIIGLQVYIKRDVDTYGGLFGYIEGSSNNDGIFNLGMISNHIIVFSESSNCYAGSIAGFCEMATIEGCYHTGYVASGSNQGASYAGGIVGYKQYGKINRCYNTGYTAGGGTLGGIVGGTKYVDISNCYNTTNKDGNYAGGIVGYAEFGGVDACYSLGNHSSSYGFGFAGGIIGTNLNGTVSNCYYTSSTTTGGGTQQSDSAMKEQSTFSGFDFTSIWTMDGNSDYPYPELQGITMHYKLTLTGISISTLPTKTVYLLNEEELDVTGGVITLTYSDGTTSTVSMTAEMVTGFDNAIIGEQTLTVTYEGKHTTFSVCIVETPSENTIEFLGGDGTENNPYLISNATHLNNVRNHLSANFLIVCDITFNEAEFTKGGAFYNNGSGWDPIGTEATPFMGNFNGGGYSIIGLRIYNADTYAGLFGVINGGKISNIRLRDGRISISSASDIADRKIYAGGLTGYAQNATFTYCTNENAIVAIISQHTTTSINKVTAYSYCGGIVAYATNTDIEYCNNIGNLSASTTIRKQYSRYSPCAYARCGGIAGSINGSIIDCRNTGDCSAYTYALSDESWPTSHPRVGGIVGSCEGSVVRCTNTGAIRGESAGKDVSGYAGGIAGFSTKIDQCWNTGSVNDSRLDGCGGIVGYTQELSNCISSDEVIADHVDTMENCISFSGYAFTDWVDAKLTNCYYYITPSSGTVDTGAILVPADALSNANTYVGFDFDNVWKISDSLDYPYPQLQFMDLAWDLTSISVCSLPEKVRYLHNVEDIDLQGAMLQLERNNQYTFEQIPITLDMISGFDNTIPGQQEITVNYGGCTASFAVQVMDENFTDYAGGIGTKDFPYIISNEEHLRNIALNPSACYRITSDITLIDSLSINSFKGVLDGNGHVISNVSTSVCDYNSGTILRLGIVGDVERDASAAAITHGGIARENSGTIEQCFVLGNIHINGRCYFANANAYECHVVIGGIAARNTGIIKDCYTFGDYIGISNYSGFYPVGDATVAGIAAANTGTIQNCYHIGKLYSKSYLGGTIYDIAPEYDNCYANLGDQMYFPSTYEHFDFKNVWSVDPFTGYSYPLFQWQTQEIEKVCVIKGNDLSIEMIEGLWPDMSAVTVQAVYADGSTNNIALIPALLEELDINKVGTQTVHLTCGDIVSEETVTFIIREKEPATLEIKKMPDKLSYVQGQPLDLDDGVLILTYSNNTTVDVNLVDAQLSYDANATGTVTVTATYEGLTVSFDITVNERIVKSVVLTQPSKLSYIEGQELDLSGGLVTVTYVSDDNYSEQIPLEISMLSGYDKGIVGIQTITFNYLEHSETFVVRVVENKVVSITITQMPQKLEYNVCQEALDVTGGIITATMLNGSTKEIEITENMVSGFDNARIGTQTLTVNYEDVTTTYTVEINATVPDRVEIQTLPTKCYYFTGETLDLTGLALKAHYGEKTAIITVFDDVAEVDMTTAGIKAVSVTFQGIETVFSVYVHEEKTDVISVDSSLYPESSHNYSNNLNETKTFTYPGAVSLTITFNSQTSVESNYDYIYIYDGNGTQIAKYTGTTAASKTLTITGDTFKVKLTSDSSQVKYGYAFSSIKATAKVTIHPAVIDPATATCAQPGLTEGSHCEICGMVLVAQEETPALGHNYEAAFSWNEDHSACAYVLTCSRCADVQTLACTIAVTDVTQQHTTHCATVEYEGQEYNDTFTCDHSLIIFVNWDGAQLSSAYYHIGTEVSAPADPTKAPDSNYAYTYAFAGWDETVVDCAGDATYTATYTAVPLEQLMLTSLPEKVQYRTGESLDLTGLILQCVYANDVIIPMENVDAQFVSADLSTSGRKTVAIAIAGKSVEFEIYVHDAKPSAINVDSSLYPESSHNYSNNLDETKAFMYPGAQSLIITFNSLTSVESNYDYIYVYDGAGNQIAKYTGTTAANKTLAIIGDTFIVRLTSDYSNVKYGYAFSCILADMKDGGEIIHQPATDPATVTCTQPGLTEGSHCEICGQILVAQQAVDALGHSYTEEITASATCTEAGSKLFSCSRCSADTPGHSYTEEIPALNHTEVIDAAVAPTCTSTGLTEGKHCSVCNEILVAQEVVASLDHTYTQGVCTVCGKKDPTYVTGVTISGSYVSFGSANETVTLQLFRGSAKEAAYTFTNADAPAASGNWSIKGVTPGSYIVRVSKRNHVTREYELTVGSDAIALDVELWLIGDVTGDGRVNYLDYGQVLSQAKGNGVLQGYALLCGDVTGDGRVNFMDYGKILSQAKGNNTLWQ